MVNKWKPQYQKWSNTKYEDDHKKIYRKSETTKTTKSGNFKQKN